METQRHRPRSRTHRPDLGGNSIDGGFVSIRKGDLGAARQERLRERLADAEFGPSDWRDLPFK